MNELKPSYFYHAAQEKNVSSILREGLKRMRHYGRGLWPLFFETDPKYTHIWHDVVIQVDALPCIKWSNDYNCYVSYKDIPPEHVRVLE